MNSSVIAVIVLAAGEASRMGNPKQMLVYRGKTLLQWAVEKGTTLKSPVAVVLGAHLDHVRASLAGYNVKIVVNQQWRNGIGTSVASGVLAARNMVDDLEGVIITLADQPNISSEHLSLLKSKGLDNKKMVATKYGNSLGVPAFFPRPYFKDLTTLRGDQGAKSLFTKYPEQVIDVTFEAAAQDIDTEQDWLDFIKGN